MGQKVMEKMDNVSFTNVSIKKSEQIKPLSTLKYSAIVNTLGTESKLLFGRLLITLSRTDKMEPYFSYELAPEPASLFSDSPLRQTAKSTLA